MFRKLTSIFMLALAGLLVLSACAPAGAPTPAQPHTIAVTGSGLVYGKPDIATAQIGVQSRDSDPAAAVKLTNTKLEAVLAALKALGIEEKDIQTTNLSVYVQSEYDPLTGAQKDTVIYVAENTLNVTVRDLAKAGDVLGQAVAAGANTVYGLSFSVSDPTALTAEARTQAMADAKNRAQQLAQAAGLTLDQPLTITENTSFTPPVYKSYDAVRLDSAAGSSVPVQSGQIQFSVEVNVTYLVK